MKIAVIGSGISGLTAAYYLSEKHDVTVLEKNDRLGGHTATVDIELDGEKHAVDTGFIVFNDWTYPNFIHLLGRLGVESQKTTMGFSVSCANKKLEYCGSGLGGLFAQKRNLLRFSFWRMLFDIVRFNRRVLDLDEVDCQQDLTLGEFLEKNRYSGLFRSHYLIPMISAIWSTASSDVLDMPFIFFSRFFKNHGLLNIVNRPQWRTIKGGSREYIQPLTERFKDNIRLGVSISHIDRDDDKVTIQYSSSHGYAIHSETYDHVVLACHSDEALSLLSKPAPEEKSILGAIPYQENRVILHTDQSIMPGIKKTWSSWNYRMQGDSSGLATLTYNMNILQCLESTRPLLVSLNEDKTIAPETVLGEFVYSHPQFTVEGIDAQSRWSTISTGRTHYCGAYWRYGFHEDGVVSAIRAVQAIDPSISSCQLSGEF